MTLEANQIKTATESALGSNAEKPNFSEVYKALSNNTSAQEQKEERTAFDQVLHQKFPDLDLIGQEALQSSNGAKDALILFNRADNHVQLRNAEDFSVVAEQDMSLKVKENNATSEQASAFLASSFDKAIEEQAKASANPSAVNPDNVVPSPDNKDKGSPQTIDRENVPDASQKTVVPNTDNNVPTAGTKTEGSNDGGKKSAKDQPGSKPENSSGTNAENSPEQKKIEKQSTDVPKDKSYVVKQGDCLWNIAKAELKAAEAGDGEVTNVSIRKYVDKIVARNRKHIKDEDLIYPGQKFILPSLKSDGESTKTGNPAAKTEGTIEQKTSVNGQTAKDKVDGKSVTGDNTPVIKNDGSGKVTDVPTIVKPNGPIEQQPDLFDDKRNQITN